MFCPTESLSHGFWDVIEERNAHSYVTSLLRHDVSIDHFWCWCCPCISHDVDEVHFCSVVYYPVEGVAILSGLDTADAGLKR